MISHIIFILITLAAIGLLSWSFSRIIKIIKLLKKPYPINNIGERISMTLKVAFGQTKIFRFPVVGIMHALVFWGFLVITVGSGEMVLDGIMGTVFDSNPLNDRIISFLGPVYDVIIASGDIFAFIILVLVIAFLVRRLFLKIKRFTGPEMRHKDHKDAALALTLILLLMVSLLGMNIGYVGFGKALGHEISGTFPISETIIGYFSNIEAHTYHNIEIINWWAHIMLIFIFANYLPYSKHFHVFMSIPNVYFSRTQALTKMNEMETVTNEVKLMLEPNAKVPEVEGEPERFGMKDVEDGTWKNYIDSLACTQCGRCTSVCPANQTGKLLSPRKIVLDYRRRMEEKMTGLLKEGKSYNDGKSLYPEYTTYEELWACTTCNACSQECPINIDHPSMILEMRRYIFLEESAAPSLINAMSTNIENNGAPWKYSAADRFNWASNLKYNDEQKTKINVPLMAEKFAENKKTEYLFWVGSSGSFDERAIEITKSFAKILDFCKVDYACLGTEETDSGDNAKRAGNEFLFQMQALMNIEVLNGYEVKKIITCDPHEFNTLKNEYCDLGGNYEVIHHTQFIQQLIKEGKINLQKDKYAEQTITYHDPCYLGRGNGEYEAPRFVLNRISNKLTEMHRNKSKSLCCGAGGTQMFKETEKGTMEVYELRTEDALKVNPQIIATSCPMCMTMMTDGIKMKNKENEIKILDISEIISNNLAL